MCNCEVCKCQSVSHAVRQTISWKEARSLLKLGNPAEYYRCFRSVERRLCRGGIGKNSKAKKQDSFVKVEIFQPFKDSPIILKGGATIEFTDNNIAYFKSGSCCASARVVSCDV